jgi:hypothetical protein
MASIPRLFLFPIGLHASQTSEATVYLCCHFRYSALPFAVYQIEPRYDMGFILLGRNKCVVLGKH